MNKYSPDDDSAFVDAAFLGPMAENAQILEEWIVQAVRDYSYWRRNAHPEDQAAITTATTLHPDYIEVKARTEDALRRLSARMKRSVPWFSPRYMGHMSSDLLLPAVVGRLLGTLYNTNNVSLDSAGPSVEMELEVGDSLATMFGFKGHTASAQNNPWGHLTSGGTVANYEAIRYLEALRLYPLALVQGLKSLDIDIEKSPVFKYLGGNTSAWKCINVPVDNVMPMRADTFGWMYHTHGKDALLELITAVEESRIEHLGAARFYALHELEQPVLIAPVSAHYSWSKGAKLTGMGRSQIIGVDVDERMRLDVTTLNRTLEKLQNDKIPVLACVSVYGTTEFGTLDPVHEVVKARKAFEQRGLSFGVHVDAAWGGYLVSVFRNEDGSLRSLDGMRKQFKYFPSTEVHQATAALGEGDSIPVDPHKLGFVPYPAGAIVYRQRDWARLQIEAAPYVFDQTQEEGKESPLSLQQLGRYILEGSKPGASAISVAVAHEVFPLHKEGFGRIIAQTVHTTERFHDRLDALAHRLRDVAHILMPFEPDTNVVCIAINAVGNSDLERCNALTRAIFDTMRFDPGSPTQTLELIGSFTSLDHKRLTPDAAHRLEHALGLQENALSTENAHVFLLRHTLMNPWLLREAEHDLDYVERYLLFLEKQIRDIIQQDS